MPKNNKKKKLLISILATIFSVAFFASGFYFGQDYDKNSNYNNNDDRLKIFWQVFDKVKNSYVGEFDEKKAIYGATKGMVESTGDPFSGYLDPKDSKMFLTDLEGEFEGIGAELAIKDNKLIVVAPLKNYPAERAGLKPNDTIVKIDDIDSITLTLDQAIDKIRGKEGSEVKLIIIHKDEATSQEVKIKREKIKIDSVSSEIKKINNKNILYIQIIQFSKDTTKLMENIAKSIKNNQPDGIAVDLRSNPGGYLDSAIDITSMFVDGEIVKEKDKNNNMNVEKATKETVFKGIKLAILVDEGSASASEIMAGAIQDKKAGTLVGQKTFGKGSVQNLENFSDGSTLRITIAKWLTPNNREINAKGIEPDIKIDNPKDNSRDLQLDKALEIVAN
ncbi:MAG: Uncharacterized protein CEN91_167 [Candidatus Berkelbacteria bacterium Licking1014_85]|uniref:Carboxy-terminal-processing protease n=1 Tax=Candidatus Berkelbacteria bacterium Licking1014_85 TaxID=2017148 RepID=A0A554LLA3_9BACT|nr:MAG: Uncharacterized protein CEN91_167 [Candidatus Berkelbacteria bacterium Licking1014_85]